MKKNIQSFFESYSFSYVIECDFREGDYIVMDFSENNKSLQSVDLSSTEFFTEYIENLLSISSARCGVGGYLEDRVIYKRSDIFASEGESRSLHLGIDIWSEVGTGIFAPYDGIVHSFQDNAGYGDYGPTIILKHQAPDFVFYTLYGHLSRESLVDLERGKKVSQGQRIAFVGNSEVNGNWPPHLHFQAMLDILDKEGDFPGVAKPSEKDIWKGNCIDPNLILRISQL